MRTHLAAVLYGIMVALAGPVQAQTTIGDPDWIFSGANNLGMSGYLAAGQTFQVPSIDNILQSFTFAPWDPYLPGSNTSTEFRFDLFSWNGSSATGPSLFSTVLSLHSQGPEMVTVTPNLTLDAGALFAAVLSVNAGDPHWGLFNKSTTYSEGSYVTQSSDGAWQVRPTDAVFSATFVNTLPPTGPNTVTPEPVSTALLGTGLAGLAVLRRRRRKQEEEVV